MPAELPAGGGLRAVTWSSIIILFDVEISDTQQFIVRHV